MIQVAPQMRMLLAVQPADFRKGIDGLSQVCRKILSSDPFSGYIFIFRNKRATAIKMLTNVFRSIKTLRSFGIVVNRKPPLELLHFLMREVRFSQLLQELALICK